MDENMDQFVKDFRIREAKLENEISRKDDEIRVLREKQLSNANPNAQRTLSNGFRADTESESAYANFL